MRISTTLRSTLSTLALSLALIGSGAVAQSKPWESNGAAADINQQLFLAARDGDVEGVKRLLAAGAEVGHVHRKQSPRNALGAAIAAGQGDVVEVLVSAGAEIHDNVRHDPTPLAAAAAVGAEDIVAFLLERGVDPDKGSLTDGFPLLAAARHGHVGIARMLLAAGADVNQTMRFDGSPLIAAARGGHEDMVALLLSFGADANQAVGGDDTPLIAAVAAQNEAIVVLLLEAGADASKPGDFDVRYLGARTPLNQARRRSSSEIVRLLEQSGAN